MNLIKKRCIIRKAVLIFMALAVSALFAACGRIDTDKYENAVIDYLSDKYGHNFCIKEIYQEFEGNSGLSVRMLCRSDRYDDTFTVVCYYDKTVADDIIIIDGKEQSIKDEYTQVLYQNIILERMNVVDSDDCIVKCIVDFKGSIPKTEDIQKGLEYCIENEAFQTYVKIYILSDKAGGTSAASDYVEMAEQIVEKLTPYAGYIYYGVIGSFDKDKIAEVYQDKQHDFGNYLSSWDMVKHLEFSLYKKKDGMQSRKIIKG